MKLQSFAEFLPVCRLRNKTRAVGSAQDSQCFLAGGVHMENLLKIEGVSMAPIPRSCDAKEFPCP